MCEREWSGVEVSVSDNFEFILESRLKLESKVKIHRRRDEMRMKNWQG